MSLQARDVGDGASSKKLFYVLLLLLLLIGLILHLRSTEYPFLPVDDAYTTLHNAQVMRAGEDRNFGTTPPLSGATSAPPLLLVTGLLTFFPSSSPSFTGLRPLKPRSLSWSDWGSVSRYINCSTVWRPAWPWRG